MRGWVVRGVAREWRGRARTGGALGFHRRLPGYRASDLIGLPGLAAALGVGAVWVKDESDRFGLPAFKILGASWATNRALAARAGRDRPAADLAQLRELAADPATTLVTASDGNHGRALARVATLLGLRARVYLPGGLGPTVATAIAAEAAEVIETGLAYDDAVRRAAASTTERPTDLLIQDTSWPGYSDVPRWIVEGYGTLFDELDEQLPAPPDLVVVPTGVGSLLQAALQHCRATDRDPVHRDPRPRVLAVEPRTAACVTRSLAAGRPVSVDTSTPTSMAGLNCGTVSELAWPVIDRGLDAAITVSEAEVSAAVAELDRHGVRVGPCGAAALAGIRAVLAAPDRRAALELHAGSVLLLISTEGRPGEAPASTVAVASRAAPVSVRPVAPPREPTARRRRR